MNNEQLFEPFAIGKLELPNRVVMAPMTRSLSPHHIPTKEAAAYYRARAEGGVGLIITEGTGINHPATHGYPDVPNLFGDGAIAGWQHVVDEVHAAGAKIFPQLWHVGSVRQRGDSTIPGYGPSAIPHPFAEKGEAPCELSHEEIQKLIAAYADAAVTAKEIGFDGIELHAAHGYLIDQFLWDMTNQRTDSYGGASLTERAQFAVEVVKAVRAAVGLDYPISFRLSQWKLGDYAAKMAKTPKELDELLLRLVEAGVDVFHCSTRRFYEPEFEGSDLTFAGWVKKLSGKPSIAVGSIGLDNDFVSTFFGEQTNKANNTLDTLCACMAKDEFDLVAVGRMLLANPDWANKIKNAQYNELVPFSQQKHANMKR